MAFGRRRTYEDNDPVKRYRAFEKRQRAYEETFNPEELYLAALMTSMDEVRKSIAMNEPYDPPGEWIADSLARLVFYTEIAWYVRDYRPTWTAKRWVRAMQKQVVRPAHQEAWALASKRGLDIQKIIYVAQVKCNEMRPRIGEDVPIAFEAKAPEFRLIRMRAVAEVNPTWRTPPTVIIPKP